MADRTPKVKTVREFKHPRGFGFSGSAGDVAVKPYSRSAPKTKPPPKDPGLAVRRKGGF